MSDEQPAPVRVRRSPVLSALVAATFVAPWSLVVLLVWSNRPYALDLVSHFLLHAAVVCVVIGALLAAARWRRTGVNLILVGVVVAVGWRLSASAPVGGAAKAGGRVVRLLEYNARQEHSRHDNDAITWIRDQKADVLVLIEPPWGLLNDYPFLRMEYPYVVEPQAGLMWEIIVLSRFPAEVQEIAEYSEENKFSFAARRSMVVRAPGAVPFLLSAMHPPSPRTKETWRRGVEATGLNGSMIAEWRRKTGMEVVIAGDFNSTPVGRIHRLFARKSGLVGWSPMVGGGTWPASMPAWYSIPIDRVWTSEGVRVASLKIGPRFRSDHRPIVAEVVLPAVPSGSPPEQAPSLRPQREREGSDDR